MNTELFIARRIIRGKEASGKLTRPIIRISVGGIAMGLAVMIIATAIVTGFQAEIRDKVIGFGSHIQINSFVSNNSLESSPILIDQPFYPELNREEGVRHIQVYATKPGIIQTKEEVQGIVAKGVATDFDWSFFRDKMISGNLLQLSDTATSDSILISRYMSRKLGLDLHETMFTYFIPERGKPKVRAFKIAGIYETGLEEFDQRIILVDIRHIQKLNNWGVETHLVSKGCRERRFAVEARAFGQHKNFQYDWGNPNWRGKGPHYFCASGDTTIRVITTDIAPGDQAVPTIPDTSWLAFKMTSSASSSPCGCIENGYTTIETNTGSSRKYYAGGFEVLLENYDELANMDFIIYNYIGFEFATLTILDQFPEIFSWLQMIDVNVLIIIILMIVVAVINMVSALLILILEKTNMIGILKAMGNTNWNIRKVFIYNAVYLIGKGLLWGNIMGLGLCAIQYFFKVVKLPQESYYISEVPINLELDHLILINLGTLVICVVALLVPSFLITKISPVKAIRFN